MAKIFCANFDYLEEYTGISLLSDRNRSAHCGSIHIVASYRLFFRKVIV